MSGLTEGQAREVEQIAELEVRRYFDHYLNNVFPQQTKALREHTYLMIEKHNADAVAHDGVAEKVKKAKWVLAGAVAVGGGLGASLLKLFGVLSG